MPFFLIGFAIVCLAAFALALLPPSKVGSLAVVVRGIAGGLLVAIGILLATRGILPGIVLTAVGVYVLLRQRGKWRGAGSQGPRPSEGPMGIDEAYAVLGLTPDASEDDIRKAHRELIQKVHPDHGGTSYLATKLNQARDILLGRAKR